MPQMGESVSEGTVLTWHKQEGDWVDKDETVVEVSTDKVDAEVPAPAAGKLVKILVQEDETVEVGQVLAEMEPSEIGPSAGKPADGSAEGAGKPADGSAEGAGKPADGSAEGAGKPAAGSAGAAASAPAQPS